MVETRAEDGLLALRLRQQAAIARLSQRALTTPGLDAFLTDAAEEIAEQLDVELVQVLERLPGNNDLLLRAGCGWPEGTVGEAVLPGGIGSLPGYALSADRPVIDDETVGPRFRVAPLLSDHGVVAGVTAPIRGARKPYGVVGAYTTRRRIFTVEDATLLQAIANVLGAAIQLRLNARAQVLLAEAGELLNGSLDYEQTLRSLARLLVPRMGDWCSIQVVGVDGAIRELEVAHRDPALAERARHFRDTHVSLPPDPRVAGALATGRPVVFSYLTDAGLDAEIGDSDRRALLRTLGARSAMLLPMVARGRTLGVIQLVSARTQRRYGYEDVALGRELAARAGLAVDNARLYRAARQTAAMREAFLSSVSHELRTPLTSVLGFAHRLARRADRFDDETRGDVETLVAEAARMRSTLDTLLNLANLESGRVRFASEPVELRHLLDEEADALIRRFPQVHVDREYCEPPCIAVTDPGRVREIVSNLLDNAAKHGGRPAHITVSLRCEGGRTTIAVRDRGPGIPAELRPQIFQRVVRGERSSASGMGLGLYLSRLIAERLRADLSIAEPAGGGTEVVLRLPLAPPPPDQDE